MRKPFFLLGPAALALAAAMPAAPARAAQGASATVAAAPAEIAIPFDPPLGERLDYRFTVTDGRDGGAAATIVNAGLTFRRDGAGFIMSVQLQLPAGMPGNDPLAVLLRQPIELRLDAEAEFTGLVDEARYWAATDRLLDDIVRQAGGDARVADAVRAAMERVRRLPEADRILIFTQKYRPLVEFAATAMAVAARVETTATTESIFGPVEQQVVVALEGVEDEAARFTSVARLPPAEMPRLVRLLEERFGARPPSPEDEAALPPERHDRYLVSLRTGLTERVETDFLRPAPAGGGAPEIVRTEVFERIRAQR